jgi:hypothetical protein
LVEPGQQYITQGVAALNLAGGQLKKHRQSPATLRLHFYLHVYIYLTLVGCDGWQQNHRFSAARSTALNSQRFAALMAEHRAKGRCLNWRVSFAMPRKNEAET